MNSLCLKTFVLKELGTTLKSGECFELSIKYLYHEIGKFVYVYDPKYFDIISSRSFCYEYLKMK